MSDHAIDSICFALCFLAIVGFFFGVFYIAVKNID